MILCAHAQTINMSFIQAANPSQIRAIETEFCRRYIKGWPKQKLKVFAISKDSSSQALLFIPHPIEFNRLIKH